MQDASDGEGAPHEWYQSFTAYQTLVDGLMEGFVNGNGSGADGEAVDKNELEVFCQYFVSKLEEQQR